MKRKELKDTVAVLIGFFYNESGRSLEDLVNLGITDIVVKKSFFTKKLNVCIHLQRPGILIGRKGYNIDQLKAYLERSLKKNVNVELKENRIYDSLRIAFNDYSEFFSME